MISPRKRLPACLAATGAVAVGALAGPAIAGAASTANIVYTTHAARDACDSPTNTSPCHIAVMNTDGQGREITSGSGNDVDPAWSPDGKRIAFARGGVANTGNYDIWVMNADGSGQQRLTTGGRDERYPTWAPDGTRIAYRGYAGATGGSQIFTMTTVGADQRPISGTAGGDQPAWSPDGKRIAYSARIATPPPPGSPPGTAGGTDDEIYVIDTAGGAPQNITNNQSTSDRYPAWYPSGTRIAFRRLDPTGQDRELWQITCADAGCHSGSVANLTGELGPGRAASWSPDASSLVFVSYRSPGGPDNEIWIGSVSGAFTARQLTNNDGNDDEPRWGNVPAESSPVPPSTGGTSGQPGGTGGGGGAKPGSPIVVGGGSVNGTKLLKLTLLVPKQKLGKRKSLRVYAKCNIRCTVKGRATAKMKPRGKTVRQRLFNIKRTLKPNRRTRVTLKIPNKTLRNVRRTIKRHRKVSITVSISARTSSGQFTPQATSKLTLRK